MSEHQPQKSNAINTISTLVNSMIGGTILTLPILFKQVGMGISFIILCISGIVAYKTCVLYVVHMSDEQKTIQETILRISGVKLMKFFKIISGYTLFALSILYMDLIQDRVYGIIYYFYILAGHEDRIAPKNAATLVFNAFSRQYLSIALALPFFFFASMKNMQIMIKLAAMGSISFMIYMIFIIYEFGSAVGTANLHDITWFSADIGNLAGTCAFSFTIHPVVGPVVKNSKHQQNNKKYLIISYLIVFSVYLAIGVMGSIAILEIQCDSTILNCYTANWRALIVEVSYLLGLVTVWPIFLQIARRRLLEFHLGRVQPNLQRNFNLVFIVLSSIIIFLNPYLSVDLLMNLLGAIFCYFLIYPIPTIFHLNCLYPKKNRLLEVGTEQNSIYTNQNQQSLNSQQGQRKQCAHDNNYASMYPKIGRFIFYGAINILGVVVGVYGIYQFIVQVFFS